MSSAWLGMLVRFACWCSISTHDGHSISEVIARDPKCPMVCYLFSVSTGSLIHSQDRRPLTTQSLFAPPPPTDLTQAPAKQGSDRSNLCSGSSAKIDQLTHLLQLIPHDAKSLVFSQFTSFLDKVAFSHHACVFALTRWIDWRSIGGTWVSLLVESAAVLF